MTHHFIEMARAIKRAAELESSSVSLAGAVFTDIQRKYWEET